jgi:chorismate-pyruvate lyase
MSEQGTEDFDTQLAAVERFIADVQQGSVPTGEAMRAYRDVHRPAIERLRAQLSAFEALLAEAGVTAPAQVSEDASGSA